MSKVATNEVEENVDMTHPGSFELHSLERNFKPTENNKIDYPRWIRNEFFNATGPTTVTRIDELTNLADKSYEGRGDTSDRQLADEMLTRAIGKDHPRFKQLVDIFARGLGEISDPGEWLHGYSTNSPKRKSTSSGSSSSSSK